MRKSDRSTFPHFRQTCWCERLGNVRSGYSGWHGCVRMEDAGRVLDGACDEEQHP